MKAATTLAGRIAEKYGEPIALPASLSGYGDRLDIGRLFPRPDKLARARLSGIGLVTSRAATIRRVASAVGRGEIDFDSANEPDDFCRAITALHGIGDWTAQYVAMRALKHPDAFPASDLGLLKAADPNGGIRPAELKKRAEAWRPWRAYAAMLLWSSLPGSGG